MGETMEAPGSTHLSPSDAKTMRYQDEQQWSESIRDPVRYVAELPRAVKRGRGLHRKSNHFFFFSFLN